MEQKYFNNEEKILVRSLALAITQRLREILPKEACVGDKSTYYIHHMYQSDFEIACATLWQLQVSKAAFREDQGPAEFSFNEFVNDEICFPSKMFPPFFSLCSDKELNDLIASSNPETWHSLEFIIEAYLRVATDYGPSQKTHLPIPRNEFFAITHPNQKVPMDAFVLNGYATKSGQHYAWTDKMAFLMLGNWLWNEASINWSLIDENHVLEETLKLLESLQKPEVLQIKIDLFNMSVAYRAMEILAKWNGDSWSNNKPKEPYLTMDEAIAISIELDKES